jgi:hypothetical protein
LVAIYAAVMCGWSVLLCFAYRDDGDVGLSLTFMAAALVTGALAVIFAIYAQRLRPSPEQETP